ncbi:MAG: adenylate/guanylate cyclase domain-containing protein [Candidatus Limnocylindrales bacterium]
MPRLQAKSFAAPDDDRTFPKVHFKTIGLDEATVGYCSFEPGWRWSADLASLVGTASCELRHLGYTISGSIRVVMNDGQSLEIGPDSVFEIPPGHDKWVVGDVPWVTVEWGASGRAMHAAMDDDAGSRTVATVMFTDIVDSTARLAEVGDTTWQELLGAHNARIRAELNVHRGREVKTTGDGFLAVFDRPTRAARCALAMIASARASGLPIRIGLHTGEVETIDGDVRGIAVHAAARVLSVAGADEALLSSTTAALLEGSGIDLEDAGTHELKGLSGIRQIFRLVERPT